MNLTLNELKALKILAQKALDDKYHLVDFNDILEIKNRWPIIKEVLKSLHVGSEYNNNRFQFTGKDEAVSVLMRVSDEITDIEASKANIRRQSWAVYLSALAAVVSALCAAIALFAGIHS